MHIDEHLARVRGLSDQDLLAGLSGVLGSSRKLTAILLAHLGEVDERRLHLIIGHGSLFAYCTGPLGMSEDEACRRIDVARLARRYPLLFDTAKVVADPLVRQRATVGGNLAHADPANDHPATMLAYAAQVVARGPKGERTIGIDDFFTGLFENALAPGEILTEIRVPIPKATSGGAYIKLERKVGDYATTGVAVQLEASGQVCTAIRIGLTNVSPTPTKMVVAPRSCR